MAGSSDSEKANLTNSDIGYVMGSNDWQCFEGIWHIEEIQKTDKNNLEIWYQFCNLDFKKIIEILKRISFF